MSTNAKASIHIKPCNIAQSEAHNRRDKEYLRSLDPKKIYIRIDLSYKNESYVSPVMNGKNLQEYYDWQRVMVKDLTGRAMQEKDVEYKDKNGRTRVRKGSSPLREGVAIIKENTTIEDLQRFTDAVQERWGIRAIQIHIHRDEGHYEESEGRRKWKANLHAHIVWDWMDHTTGKSLKLKEKDISEMQDMLAKELKMQRGQRKSETGLDHLEREEFVLHKLKDEQQATLEKTAALESYIKAMEFDEEELAAPELETDPLVEEALKAILEQLAIPIPVMAKDKWKEDRKEEIKKIVTEMETKLFQAKNVQKKMILRLGNSLYKQARRNVTKLTERCRKLQEANENLTTDNTKLKKKLASVDEGAVWKLWSERLEARSRAEQLEKEVSQERSRADNAETRVREMLAVPEINRFWERIKRNKDAFLKLLNQRIADAERVIYTFAKNRDNIFSNKTELIIGNGIISEAILCGLDPTNDDQRKKAADNLLERIDWKGTYQSSYELAVSRTEDLSNEISVSSQLLENLILAAGGRGVTGSGGGGSNNELTNWDGTKKNTGWSRSR
jgi:hypothetical protein